MLRHLPNPTFDAAIVARVAKGATFRNTKTGETVVGDFSSSLTSNLRYDGWSNVGRPVDVEDLAEERIGLRVVHVYESGEWEEAASPWRAREDGWRKVRRYATLVVADDSFLAAWGAAK